MKTFIVILIVGIVAVSGTSLSDLNNGSSKVKVTVRQCLIDYKIDPAVLELDAHRNDDLYDSLTDEQKGCVTACLYKGFNWLRPDGSLDIDLLTEGDTAEESAAEKEKYLKIVNECRAEVGKDDCKFFHCVDSKDSC